MAESAVANLKAGERQSLGAPTGRMHVITCHDRLLRSLSFGNPDYAGHAHAMTVKVVDVDHGTLDVIATYVGRAYSVEGEGTSPAPSRDLSNGNLVAVLTFFAPHVVSVFDV